MKSIVSQSIRPFRRWRDYRTRSTRTELIGFGIVCGLIGVAAQGVAVLAGADAKFDVTLAKVLGLILLVPGLPLAVRRLHDSGRGAVALVMTFPIWASDGYGVATRLRYGRSAATDPPWWLDALFLALVAAVLVMLLWNDDPLPNKYGPNPRDENFIKPQTTQPVARS
ncbi:MAG: hypothetical protein QOJ94_1478 [Sphingomonadales bacterium]|nr:hypothetical protein [Sphingomonadales bacterium]